ncbi:MAG: hypothetical protein KTV77_05420 [Wolbachia endosymbiont of Fragariocoptes setiger]|nr:hypothetical protein [Wolbachia endosymbiont of Fragariocoptes setiger]
MNYNTLAMEDYKPNTKPQDQLEEIVNNIQSNSKEITSFAQNEVISDDGLTLAEVLQVLIEMLNGDLDLLKKVLLHAGIMVKHGMRIPKESKLTKASVRQTLKGRKSSTEHDSMKISPTVPNMKLPNKKGIGI